MSVLRAYRGLLSNGPLVRLLSGEFISSIGDWLYLVALLIVVYETNQDPVLLGVVGAARILPYVLLSYVAGVVADRFERRVVLLVTDVVRGSIMVAMAWLVGTDGPLWAIVALAILATCFSCFFGPTIGAYLPSLVRDERELGPANSAWSTLDNLAFVIGPAVAALLITASGLTLAFVLNAISFAFVAVILWRLPKEHGRGGGKASTTEKNERSMAAVTGATDVAKPTVTPTETSSATGGGNAIGRTLRSSVGRSLVGLTVIETVAAFVFGGLGVMTVVLASAQLAADQAATGLLNAAIGIGGILGAIGSSAFVVRPGLRIPLVGGSIALAIGMAMLGVFGSLGPALVAMALASAGNLLTEVVSMTIFQRIVPDPIRGRALGAMATITTLAYATGSLLMPVWSGAFGIGPVFVASGLLVVVGAILAIVLIGRGGDRAPAAVFVSTAARVAALPIFAGIPESRLATAFARAQELETVAGGEVIRQGDPADRFFVILEGSFDVDQVGPDGRAERLRTMAADEVFGEIGLLTGAPRSATVTAVTDGRILALEAPDFLALVEAGAEVGPRLLALHRGGGRAA